MIFTTCLLVEQLEHLCKTREDPHEVSLALQGGSDFDVEMPSWEWEALAILLQAVPWSNWNCQVHGCSGSRENCDSIVQWWWIFVFCCCVYIHSLLGSLSYVLILSHSHFFFLSLSCLLLSQKLLLGAGDIFASLWECFIFAPKLSRFWLSGLKENCLFPLSVASRPIKVKTEVCEPRTYVPASSTELSDAQTALWKGDEY